MRLLFCFLGLFAVVSGAHAEWVPVATVNEKTPGHLCDIDDNGLDLFCGATNPEILADGTISATNLSIGDTISTSSLFVNGQAITGVTQSSGTSFIEWGFKEGPTSFVSAYINSWDQGGETGTSIDCTSNANGCTIESDGTYDVTCYQRGNGSGQAFIGVALNGDRSTLQNSSDFWTHDNTPTTDDFSMSRYVGTLDNNDLITCGTSDSTIAGRLTYAGNNLYGGMVIKRIDGFATPDADNLGNHTATQALNLNGNWLSGDGDAEGLQVLASGVVSMSGPIKLGGTGSETCASAGDHNMFRANPSTGHFELCRD